MSDLFLGLLRRHPDIDSQDILRRIGAIASQPFGFVTPGGGPSVPVTGPAASGEWTRNGSSVSLKDRYAVHVEAGFSAEEAVKMAAITMFECASCDMGAVNASGDVGLDQINRQHWPRTGGPDVLVDPRASARAARMVFLGAGGGEAGFRQW